MRRGNETMGFCGSGLGGGPAHKRATAAPGAEAAARGIGRPDGGVADDALEADGAAPKDRKRVDELKP